MVKLDWSDQAATRSRPRTRSRRLAIVLATLASAFALVAAGPSGIALGDDEDNDKKKETEAVTLAEAPVNYTPTNHTTFNNPQSSTAAQRRIIDELNKMINATDGGQTIRISSYLFDATTTGNALVAAYRRGVNVQMLIDDGDFTESAVVRVRNAIRDNPRPGSYVRTCSNGCHSPSPSIIHAKIFLFSKVGSANWVAQVGSANPYYHNVFNSWNNMQTVVGNKAIYDSLSQYIDEMLEDENGNAYRTTTSGNYKLYFFPKTSGDPMILEVLRGVSCSGVTGGYGSGGKTVIRIAMWGWSSPRVDIAEELNALHRRGCKVEVLLNKDRTSKTVFSALLRSSSTYGKMKIYDGWYDGNDNGIAGLYVHHKVLMINGNWFSDSGTKVVYTGSQNYTDEGLRRNNEVVLRVKIDGVYNAFYYNFAYIRDNWTKGRITSVPAFVGEKNSAELRRLGLDTEQEIEALTDDGPGWYVPPGEVADSD